MVTNQQRITRSLLVIALAALALVFLYHGAQAQLRGGLSLPLQPADEPAPAFTRMVTVAIESGDPLTPALTSFWQAAWISFPVSAGGISFPIPLPSDATDVTATVTCGTYDIVGNTVQFTLTESIACHFGYELRTDQRVTRQGNQYRIDQVAGNDTFVRYIATIVFTAPYQFVGFIGPTPMTITSDMLHWEQVMPENEPPFHRFRSSIWLADPRVTRPDLQIITASLELDASSIISSAQVTAVIYNSSTMESGAPTHINLYDRLAPSSPPTGPLDLDGGWCGLGTTPACPSTASFTNPVPIIAAGETMTLTTDYTFAQCGPRDLYLQIDVFGGEAGLNLEADETNNQIALGQVFIPCLIHLPLIRK